MLITEGHIETYSMIDHGNGLATLYGHCSNLLAKAGQTVEAGDESKGISAKKLKRTTVKGTEMEASDVR